MRNNYYHHHPTKPPSLVMSNKNYTLNFNAMSVREPLFLFTIFFSFFPIFLLKTKSSSLRARSEGVG